MTGEERAQLFAELTKGNAVAQLTEEMKAWLDKVDCQEKWIKTTAGETRVLLIEPKGQSGIRPLYINLHGGGFVAPYQVRDTVFCAMLACVVGCVVLDVDYKTTDTHTYPAALNECYDVVKWAFAHAPELRVDKEKIALGGHSAGGNLTAGVTLKAKQTRDFKLCAQILDFPVLDLHTDVAQKKDSPDNEALHERMRAFNRLYFANEEQSVQPSASPVFAPVEMLVGLPDTLVITAGQDCLRFEAYEYTMKLIEAGVTVVSKCFVQSRHGFLINCVDEYKEAQKLYIQALKSVFAK